MQKKKTAPRRGRALKIVAIVGVILLALGGLAVWLLTSSTKVSLELPSTAKHYRLSMRVPRIWKLDLDLFHPEDPRFVKSNLKNALKRERGATVAIVFDRWRLALGGATPGVASVHYFPNKKGLSLLEFVHERRSSRPGYRVETIQPLHGTERVLQTIPTRTWIMQQIYLWEKGYGGVCVVTIMPGKYDSPQMKKKMQELLYSAYLE